MKREEIYKNVVTVKNQFNILFNDPDSVYYNTPSIDEVKNLIRVGWMCCSCVNEKIAYLAVCQLLHFEVDHGYVQCMYLPATRDCMKDITLRLAKRKLKTKKGGCVIAEKIYFNGGETDYWGNCYYYKYSFLKF